VERASQARSALAHLLGALLALGALLVCGGIPASVSLQRLILERSAPPLPGSDAELRDAALDVLALGPAGAIHGARVHVLALRDEVDGRRAYAVGDAVTARNGHAHLQRLPRGQAWVSVDADGLARASTSLVLEAGERPVQLALEHEHRLDVEVKDERGVPLGGAEIEIAEADPLPVGARSGADGVAHVGRLSVAPWAVTVRARGFDEVQTRGVHEGDPLRVVLHALGAIVVHVVSDRGEGVAQARVQIASPTLWPARVAESGNDGVVRIGALPAGTYALRAANAVLASPIELGVDLARGQERSVTLRLAPSEMVEVHVVGDDDAPVFGARVTLAESGLSPFPLEATTDREGRARLGPIARGSAALTVRAEGYVARELAVPDPLSSAIAVTLAHAGVVEGRVVDARGFPIGGATIEIVGTSFDGVPIDDDPRRARFTDAQFSSALAGPRPLMAAGELGVMPGPVPPIPAAGTAIAVSPASGAAATGSEEPWVTRGDGTYRAAPVSPGRVRVLVHHPQFVDAVSDAMTLPPGGTKEADVVLHAGGILEGRVVDASGRGVEGARVVAAAARSAMEHVARTASDGSFGFAAMPADVVLLVSPDDEGSQVELRAPVSVPEGGKTSLTLQLGPARDPLPVRVVDDRGYPLGTAQVTVVSVDPASALRETVFTDERGDASLPRAKGIALRAEVIAPGHAPAIVHLDASASELSVSLALAESARGEVRSSRGDALADAEVVLYGPFGARRTRTNAEGEYALDDLPAGSAHLVIRAPGFAPASRDVTVDANGGRRPSAWDRVELAAGGAVEGVVVDAHGDPVAGARVASGVAPTYVAAGTAPPGVATTDARGRFRVVDLGEGTVVLDAFAADVGRVRQEVHVSAGETTRDVRFVLRAEPGDKPHEPTTAGSLAVTLGETGDPPEVVVVAVAEASEAERAGLAPGDAIESVGGVKVTTMEDARAKMSGPLGDDVLLTIRRGDGEESLRVAREPVRR
jgi:hypothetical protein